jgi:hypothetical protein
MKYILPLLLLFSVHVASAEDPAELVKLRTIYDNSLRGEFQKVGKLYHGRLVELKDNFMEAKNLDGANAVDAEIKKLVELHGKHKLETPSPLDGVWTVTTDKVYIKLFKDDKVLIEKGVILNITKKGGAYYVNWANGHWHKLTPKQGDPDVMDCLSKNGKKYTYVRLKW